MSFGLLNIDKPSGPTSHDIVAAVRRGTGIRRVGHAGTLDPLAEGVLVVAVGRATRLVEYLTASHKEYHAVVTLGVTTDSYDAEGSVLSQVPVPANLSPEVLDGTLEAFRGEIAQVPPVYSAVKVKGKSAHARVRAGEQVTLAARQVTISHLELLCVDLPRIELLVHCSPGTYIRSLAHDLGQTLGCGAMLSGLRRLASGHFRGEEAVSWPVLQAAFEAGTWEEHLLPADLALRGTPRVVLNGEDLRIVLNGGLISAPDVTGGLARAYAEDGTFVAVLVGDPARQVWRPRKVFAQS